MIFFYFSRKFGLKFPVDLPSARFPVQLIVDLVHRPNRSIHLLFPQKFAKTTKTTTYPPVSIIRLEGPERIIVQNASTTKLSTVFYNSIIYFFFQPRGLVKSQDFDVSDSMARNATSRLRLVFLFTLLSRSSHFLRTLKQNRACSRLLYLLNQRQHIQLH